MWSCTRLLATVSLALSFVGSAHSALLAVNSAGDLFNVSPVDASASLIGSTGLSLGSLEFSPGGTLFAHTIGAGSTLYSLNPTTAAATAIGSLGLGFVFEGAIAFSPAGVAYATNGDNALNAQLLTLNLGSGAATVVATITPGDEHDINGLAWRSDGMLIGLDRPTDSLLVINPLTAAAVTLAALTPTVGAVGGMAVLEDVGYFATASNELWSFDLTTGAHALIGTIPVDGQVRGLAASLSAAPEPGTLLLLAVGLALLSLRDRFRFAMR